ncbi:uncharacterized protein YlxW (UPF0749 family) [Jatrophihabitans sp. GAS493]|uniref:DUF881 domain-containing protein n=1 Tax=Jatrophihabitans sp. GAS493 TaxID=1907575 RepID=UPI000BB967A4|nr:DUF881 domain-containing protein [Jatrophihabitans sp. GAS493]SOD73817.1 uncharacterized protein YlxW (UPF0749 family) [Jatrophihabitans sp. GAS493]
MPDRSGSDGPAEAPDPAGDAAPAGEPIEAPAEGKRRTSHRRAGALIGVLAALLGFAIVVQVRSNSSQDSLSNARDDDLVGIIANQNELAERRRDQISDLQRVQQQLQASGNVDGVAQQQAEQETQALGVLLGTVPATGPGITATITDPQGNLKAEDLLDVIEELRGAGAEAIQFGPVRVGTSTNFVDTEAGVSIDGTTIKPPYVVRAIGDPKTMDTALNIPGGVAATVRVAGGDLTVIEQPSLTITAVRALPSPKYAAPTPH